MSDSVEAGPDLPSAQKPDVVQAWILEAVESPAALRRRPSIAWRKVALFVASLFLLVLAISLMKEGARSLTPLVRDRFAVTNPANSLGFGWLFAYVVMSGSSVAAAALTFFDAGALSQLSAFTMITGSRLGASFIVLFIGFIYVLRGRNRATSESNPIQKQQRQHLQ